MISPSPYLWSTVCTLTWCLLGFNSSSWWSFRAQMPCYMFLQQQFLQKNEVKKGKEYQITVHFIIIIFKSLSLFCYLKSHVYYQTQLGLQGQKKTHSEYWNLYLFSQQCRSYPHCRIEYFHLALLQYCQMASYNIGTFLDLRTYLVSSRIRLTSKTHYLESALLAQPEGKNSLCHAIILV